MTITGKAVLITGANRGIGQALVEEALSRGAKRVYAGTRETAVRCLLASTKAARRSLLRSRLIRWISIVNCPRLRKRLNGRSS